MLTFRDTDKTFELQDLLKMITYKNYNVDFAYLPDKKIMYEFAKEMYFEEKVLYIKYLVQWFLLLVFQRLTKRNFSQKQDFYHLILTNFVID